MTRVVKVTKAGRAAVLADPDFVWVGRPSGRLGMKASAWANPYRVGPALTRAEAVERFRSKHLPRLLRTHDVASLRGKLLGCACCDWSPGEPVVTPCHAIVLAMAADA